MYLWDTWFIKSGGLIHAYHLQCKSGVDPDMRHDNDVTIGHAVSDDLLNWRKRPAALVPGAGWDNLSLWTGSVVEHDGGYRMFYTGRNRMEHWVQRIGEAASDDLDSWVKGPEPVLSADERYYDTSKEKNALGNPPAWRDPYVFHDDVLDEYCMLIAARDKKKQLYNGCIGFAVSADLDGWSVKQPILSPGRYDEMETPQMVVRDDRYYLLFSTHAGCVEPAWAKEADAVNGLYCYVADSLNGDYRPVNGTGIVLDYGDRLYDARLVEPEDEGYKAVGFLERDKSGSFVGGLSRPFKVVLDGDRAWADF